MQEVVEHQRGVGGGGGGHEIFLLECYAIIITVIQLILLGGMLVQCEQSNHDGYQAQVAFTL